MNNYIAGSPYKITYIKSNLYKYYISFLLTLTSFLPANGQNLLPNGDFSEKITCIEYDQECGPMGWKLTSSDPPTYFEEYNSDSVRISQWTAVVMKNFYIPDYREYLQAPILCPLIKGKKYLVRIEVKPNHYAVRELDIAFLPSYAVAKYNTLLPIQPAIKFYNDKFLLSKSNDWLTLTRTFIATGYEKYILIGNFQSDASTYAKHIDETKGTRVSYFVKKAELLQTDNSPICDYSNKLALLRKDRYRHTLFMNRFFPNFDSLETRQTQANKSISGDDVSEKPELFQPVYFKFNRFNLDNKSKSVLDSLSDFLLKNKGIFVKISGHTDNIGSDSYNLRLSIKRAQSAGKYLQSKGINKNRIVIQGLGSSNPIETNNTPDGRQINRRAEFVLFEAEK